MTREVVLDNIWQVFRSQGENVVVIKTPQGVAILQTNGNHLLVRVDYAVLEVVSP